MGINIEVRSIENNLKENGVRGNVSQEILVNQKYIVFIRNIRLDIFYEYVVM